MVEANPAKELALDLRREGRAAVAVVLVDEEHRVHYWTDAMTWGLAGSLLGGMHVAATGLAAEIDAHAISATTSRSVEGAIHSSESHE